MARTDTSLRTGALQLVGDGLIEILGRQRAFDLHAVDEERRCRLDAELSPERDIALDQGCKRAEPSRVLFMLGSARSELPYSYLYSARYEYCNHARRSVHTSGAEYCPYSARLANTRTK